MSIVIHMVERRRRQRLHWQPSGLGNVDEWVGGIPKDLRRIEWLGVGWTVSAECRPGEY